MYHMKKNHILLIVAAVLVVTTGIVITVSQKPQENSDDIVMTDTNIDTMVKNTAVTDEKNDTAMKDDNQKVVDTGVMEKSPAVYATYSADALAQAQRGDGAVILFFHATWCPNCQALDKSITSNINAIPQGVTILKTDYDSESALKKKYGITYQHTLVQVDDNGNAIKVWSGSNTALDLSKFIVN